MELLYVLKLQSISHITMSGHPLGTKYIEPLLTLALCRVQGL